MWRWEIIFIRYKPTFPVFYKLNCMISEEKIKINVKIKIYCNKIETS